MTPFSCCSCDGKEANSQQPIEAIFLIFLAHDAEALACLLACFIICQRCQSTKSHKRSAETSRSNSMKSPFNVARRRRQRKATRCLADEAEDAHPTTPQDSEALGEMNESHELGKEAALVSAKIKLSVEGQLPLPEGMPMASVTAPSELETIRDAKAPGSSAEMADWIRSLHPHQKIYFYAAVFGILSFCATKNGRFLLLLPLISIAEISRHILIWTIYITGTAEFAYVTDVLIMLGGRAKTEVERTREGGFFRRRYEAVVLGGANQFSGTAWGVFSGYVHNTQERAKERRDKATEDFLVALRPLKKSD